MAEQAFFASVHSRIQGEIKLSVKAWQDDAFKQTLLENPKLILEQEFGVKFSDDLSIQIIQAQPDRFYLRIPFRPDLANLLSFDELIQVLSRSEGEEVAPLMAKAWKDECFRRALLHNPKAVIAEELGASLPDSLTIEVLEETATTLMVILLVKPDSLPRALSDEELETIAGGVSAFLKRDDKKDFMLQLESEFSLLSVCREHNDSQVAGKG